MENKALHETAIRAAVYEAIAQLLPTLGRDFTVSINIGNDLHHADIAVKGLTIIGKAVELELNSKLKIKLHEIIMGQNKGADNGRKERTSRTVKEVGTTSGSKVAGTF
ncbi:hypothetical protein ACFLQL_00680 [Verrucomicrobiota bacterium]